MIAANWKPPSMAWGVLLAELKLTEPAARLIIARFVTTSRALALNYDAPGRALLCFAYEVSGSGSYRWMERLTRADAAALSTVFGNLGLESRHQFTSAGSGRASPPAS